MSDADRMLRSALAYAQRGVQGKTAKRDRDESFDPTLKP